MPDLLFINPNSTDSMTRSVVQTAERVLGQARIKGWTCLDGPASIQGEADGKAAVPPLLSHIEVAEDADAIVIACFDDTGLAEARKIANCPVIGIGQAAYHMAALKGTRFSIITTLAVSIPILEANIAAYGFSHLLGRVRASDIPVLELEADIEASFKIITGEAEAALAEDQVDAIILGCAGMTGLADHLRKALGVPIIDGVEAAAHLAFALANMQ